MMTGEEILSLEEYCAEHKTSYKKCLEELDISFWDSTGKEKYRKDEEQHIQSGEFIQSSLGKLFPSDNAYQLALTVNLVNSVSRLKKRTRTILP